MRGALAFCSRGELGLITSHAPMPVHYSPEPACICASDGDYHHITDCPVYEWRHNPSNHGIAWVGIHLGNGKLGEPWSSRNPKILGVLHIADVNPKDLDVAIEYIRRLALTNVPF